jgi:hypothetical protein
MITKVKCTSRGKGDKEFLLSSLLDNYNVLLFMWPYYFAVMIREGNTEL